MNELNISPCKFNIYDQSDVIQARRAAEDMALAVGFGKTEGEEISIAVSELATNLVKHAGGGTLSISPLEGAKRGIEVETLDRGPGIPDVEKAAADGYSTTETLGSGLGAVNRLMDDIQISSIGTRMARTRVVAKRWLIEKETELKECPLDIGAATRPKLKSDLNGDAFVVAKWDANALVGVIDGLGHGSFAHRASNKAKQYIENHYYISLKEIFRNVGRELRSTRGAVMALAVFNWGNRKAQLASVGDIMVWVSGRNQPMSLMARKGVIGLNALPPVVSEISWEPGSIMVIHSDGVSPHWRWEDFSHLVEEPSASMAKAMLDSLSRDYDDATVVVVKWAGRSVIAN